MNRKLGRLLRPGMGAYFFVMAAFCAAALLVGHYWLAAGEMTVTVVTFLLYVLDRTRRERKIQQYIQSASNTLEASSGGEAPLPAVMVRLGDGDIVWGNHRFSELTGYADTMTQLRLEEVLPDFTLDWLTAGKTESPHDAVLGNRRYRVYGTTSRAGVCISASAERDGLRLIAVVLGALVLAGLYAILNDTVMPTVTQKITEMFSYNG